jgi:hypothetical protein
MDHMTHWNAMCRPPEGALKRIKGGRLNGMTDISPQWRYQVMTEHFGPVGIGWRFTVDKCWLETGETELQDNEICAFALITLYVKHEGEWSEGIPGNGGSKLVTQEKEGPHTSDECFKMAITDALSTAMKMLGVAADIYSGFWDGSKYLTPAPDAPEPAPVHDEYEARANAIIAAYQHKIDDDPALVEYVAACRADGYFKDCYENLQARFEGTTENCNPLDYCGG